MPPSHSAPTSQQRLADSAPLSNASSSASPEEFSAIEEDAEKRQMYVKVLTKKSRFQGEAAELRRRVDDLAAEAAGFHRQAQELSAELGQFGMNEEEFGEFADVCLGANGATQAEQVVEENAALKLQVDELKREMGSLKSDIHNLMTANRELMTANEELEQRVAANEDAYERRLGTAVIQRNELLAHTVETMAKNHRQQMAFKAREVAELKRQVGTLMATNTEYERRMAAMAKDQETLKEDNKKMWAFINAHFPNAAANVQN